MELSANKTALVIGLAKSGYAASRALLGRGVGIVVTDLKDDDLMRRRSQELAELGAEVLLGPPPIGVLGQVDFVVVSPGVPDTSPLLIEAKRLHIPVISEPELAYRLYAGPYLAITGSNGKTTTTSWLGQAFQAAGIQAVVGGNIGRPLTEAVGGLRSGTWVIAELSSFQLQYVDQFRPAVSAILNLSADHLDRHGSFAAYRQAKANIFVRQQGDDYLVLNADDPYYNALAASARCRVLSFSSRSIVSEGAYIHKDRLYLHLAGQTTDLLPVSDLALPGLHNAENALAVACLAAAANIPPPAIVNALESFAGVEHRCEPVATISGVAYVNDSKGTNPEAAIRALQAFCAPIVLIAGGHDKGTDLADLIQVVKQRCRAVVLIGAAAPRFGRALAAGGFPACRVFVSEDLESAVSTARDLAVTGDTVLLSPACASFDMFTDYEQRGRVFKDLVARLGGESL